jgi:hypothetical protein
MARTERSRPADDRRPARTPEEVEADTVERVRACCRALPDAYEEQAWLGTRWRIRGRTFAHVLTVEGGHPPAYARATHSEGPVTVLAFRSRGEELEALRGTGHPFFVPPWRDDEVLLALGDAPVDWDEVRELVTESYCLLAPKTLAARVERPGDGGG